MCGLVFLFRCKYILCVYALKLISISCLSFLFSFSFSLWFYIQNSTGRRQSNELHVTNCTRRCHFVQHNSATLSRTDSVSTQCCKQYQRQIQSRSHIHSMPSSIGAEYVVLYVYILLGSEGELKLN